MRCVVSTSRARQTSVSRLRSKRWRQPKEVDGNLGNLNSIGTGRFDLASLLTTENIDGTDNFHDLHVFWCRVRGADRIYTVVHRVGTYQSLMVPGITASS